MVKAAFVERILGLWISIFGVGGGGGGSFGMRLWRRVETRARREKTAGEEQTACPRRPRCTIAVDKQRTNITSLGQLISSSIALCLSNHT